MSIDIVIDCDICGEVIADCCGECSENFSPDDVSEFSLFLTFPDDDEDEGRWCNLCDECKDKLNHVLLNKG